MENVTLQQIIDAVATALERPAEEVRGRDRSEGYVLARYVFFALAEEHNCGGRVAIRFIHRSIPMVYWYRKQVSYCKQYNHQYKFIYQRAKNELERLKSAGLDSRCSIRDSR
jgi:hypothetical protein